MKPTLASLDHLVLTVADLDRTVEFYTGALGMKAQHFDATDGTMRHALRFGDQKINLHQAGHEFAPKAAYPAPGSADLCFLSHVPLADWMRHLETRAVAIEEGPVARTGALGPITSIYLRDPDGNLIEISNPS